MADGSCSERRMAERLFAAAIVRFAVFRSLTGGYLAVDQQDPRPGTVLVVRDEGLQQRLAKLAYDLTGMVPREAMLRDVTRLLCARAQTSPGLPCRLRVGGHDQGLLLDLSNRAGEVVAITPQGYAVRPAAAGEVFLRPAKQLPLPAPRQTRPSALRQLRSFLNLATPDDELLVLAWLVSACQPQGPYPLLQLLGPPGAAKSTTQRLLRDLLDPCTAPLATLPADDRGLMIAAHHSHVLCFDNLRRLSPQLSDLLCMLATGGGYTTRQLYTDTDEVVLAACRPVIISALAGVVTQPDLLDRTVTLVLPAVALGKRRDPVALEAAYEQQRPLLLGGLCALLSRVMARLPTITLAEAPRMIGFARLGVAVEQVLGWPPGSFLRAYAAAQAPAVAAEDAVPAWEVALGRLLTDEQPWQGTAARLRQELARVAGPAFAATVPNPRSLSVQLRAQIPRLHQAGLAVRFDQRLPGSDKGIVIAALPAPAAARRRHDHSPWPPPPRFRSSPGTVPGRTPETTTASKETP